MDTSGSVVTSLSVTWQGYGILGHPKLTLALLISPIHATHFHAHAGTRKSNRMSWVSRRVAPPMNGNGHFRERCDVTKRHLARVWNFRTLRAKINPCPIACTFHTHAKAIQILVRPERWPRPINGSGHFWELRYVTKCHAVWDTVLPLALT